MSRRLLSFPALLALAVASGCSDVRLDPFESVRGVTVADLDGDGRPDVALASAFVRGGGPAPGRVWVFLQDPAASPGTFLPGEWYGVGREAQEVVAADFDGDGRPDLAVTNLDSDSVSVLRQDPADPGRFLDPVHWATGVFPTDLAAGDVDGDGVADLVVSAFEPSVGRRVVQILFGDPMAPGDFLAPVFLDLGIDNAAVAVGDFDGDARGDLAATLVPAPDVTGAVAILLQDPAMPGSFLDLGTTVTGIQPLDVAIGELDGDGLPDVVTAEIGDFGRVRTAGVSVLLQDAASPSGLAPAVQYQAGISPHGVRIGDLDGDGLPDLAAVSPFEITLWLQDPAVRGSFLLGARIAARRVTGGLDLGDLDADGRLDLVVADDESVVVHLQDPAQPGAFLPPVTLPR